MQTNFNGTTFTDPARNTFSSAFDGGQPRQARDSLMTRRTLRAARRANRSL